MRAGKFAATARRVEVQVLTRRWWVPTQATLRRWAEAALSAGTAAPAAGRTAAAPKRGTGPGRQRPAATLSIRIVGVAESRRLDRLYRGKDEPTNVLSFPASTEERALGGTLGDLVVCAPVVAREAREQGKRAEAHWAHMVVHGTLHLLGFDHERSGRAARRMERLEVEILCRLGFDDPYRWVARKAV